MRRFVVIGRRAEASADFSLVDFAGTSGRLDVLTRCMRAALLVSHGLRKDTVVYLVLLGGSHAPRTVRVESNHAAFIRPDERSLAVLLQKSLAAAPGSTTFATVRPGIAIAQAGLDAVLQETAHSTRYVLDRAGEDIRAASTFEGDVTFFLGDHLGLEPDTRAVLEHAGARPVSLGPVDVHAEDALSIVWNELDRRGCSTYATV